MSEPEPSDTLYVQVTDVQHPVTEEVLRQVFEPIGAVQRVHIFPTVGQATKTTAAIVQFSSKDAANTARRKRDGVKIYPGCNRMEITFTSWESFMPPAPPTALMAAPAMYPSMSALPPMVTSLDPSLHGGALHVPSYGVAHSHMSLPAGVMHTTGAHMMHGHVDASGGYGMSYIHHGSPVDSNVLPPRLAVSAPSFRGGVRGRTDSLHGSSADSAVMPPSHRPDSVVDRESAEHHAAQPRVRGSAPLPMRGVSMNPVCRPSRGPARGRGDEPGDGRLNAFVSVSRLPEHIPFLPLFLLLEVYGTVQTMRRNQRNHEIVMVKMGSVAEVQTVVRCLCQTPFYESTVSGRAFANYVGPISAISKDGDPRDPSCWQFDFVDYRHRPHHARCQVSPGRMLHMRCLPSGGAMDGRVRSYFDSLGFGPLSVRYLGPQTCSPNYLGQRRDEYEVEFPDVAMATMALIESTMRPIDGDRDFWVVFSAQQPAVSEERRH